MKNRVGGGTMTIVNQTVPRDRWGTRSIEHLI